MTRLPMSSAAAALLRSLIARAGVGPDRILLTEVQSIDWQSLTFIGERHSFHLRIPGPGSAEIGRRIYTGLEDAEFTIASRIVADVALVGEPVLGNDGSTCLTIEALTVDE